MCRGDDVDDCLCVGGVLGRGIGDGLDAGQYVGREGLEVGLEILLGEFRGLVVNPDFHARDTAQCHVALHVDLHARGVLKGVLGGTCLDARVLADVVNHLLAVHGVDGALGGNLHGVEGGGAWHHLDGAEGGVVLHLERYHAVLVADGGDAQQVGTQWHAVDLEQAVEVGGAAFDEGRVSAVEHSHVDEGQELAADGVAQRSHHLEGVAFLHFLFLLHGVGVLVVALAVPVLSGELGLALGALASRRTAAGESSRAAGLCFQCRHSQQNHHCQSKNLQNSVFSIH